MMAGKYLAICGFALVLAGAPPVLADCLRDKKGSTICGPGPCAQDMWGDVFCAPDKKGTAVRRDDGEVVCGWGACARGGYGGYFCATDPGGDISTQGGDIACFGGCEVATAALCKQAQQQL